jgi:outer membrane protein
MFFTRRLPTAVSAALLCGLVGSAAAQTPPTQEPPAPAPAPAPPAPAAAPTVPQSLTIMIVDVQALLQNSKAAKMVRSQIEAKRAEYAKEISHQDEVLRQERDALQRQQASLTPDALNQKGREFQQKVNDLDKNVQSKRQALEKSYNEAVEKIQATLLKIIEQIAKDRKANLVLQRTELVLFDQAFDVTDEVLQKLDEQLPTLTVEFVPPVAATSATTPAATTPAAATNPADTPPNPAATAPTNGKSKKKPSQ